LLRAATVACALIIGLANGTRASAAPLPGSSKPPENPFGDSAKQAAGDEAENAAPEATPPAEEAEPMSRLPEAATSESGDESSPEGQEGGQAGGQEGSEDGGEEPESALHGLACLEGDTAGGRRKGVQRRDFLKRHRFELSGVGGFYASDALSSTYSYGGALSFYPSEDFGLEALVTRSPVRFRLEEPFSAFDSQQHFQPGVAWQAIGSLLWSPIHAKFKFTDATIIHGDLFVVAGAGRTFHDSVLGLTYEAGLGMKLYLWRYVAFRLDVRDFLLPQEVLGRGRTTNNITVLAGVSAWIL
jgi:outer membrane beta-barrel protein